MFATTIIAASANAINGSARVVDIAARLLGILFGSASKRLAEMAVKAKYGSNSLLKSNPALSAECDSWLRWMHD